MAKKPKPRKKKPITEPVLKTWIALNNVIRKADEAECLRLLQAERSGRRRQQFMLRIHSRLNRVRRERERREITK